MGGEMFVLGVVVLVASLCVPEVHSVKCIEPNKTLFDDLKGLSSEEVRPPHLDDSQKLQYFNDFTCEYLPPSDTVPTSVHALRPGDIKIVAALGDSLTAGNGAGALSIIGVRKNYRGLSFSIGGYYKAKFLSSSDNDDVLEHFSLPNALKFYNPDIKGWASGIADPGQPGAQLDEAVMGSKAWNLSSQAHQLVAELKANPEYDFENDWKMLTILIGGNNLCQWCVDDRSSPDNFVKDIQDVLDYIHENMPRTFVNLLTIFNIDVVSALGKDQVVCGKAHDCFCYCAMLEDAYSKITLQSYNGLYRDNLWQLVQSNRYDTKDDFTVVIQPFLEQTTPPFLDDNKTPDLSYFAPDCFHFSQKGHNYAGEALWNNLFQKAGAKSTKWSLGENLECPSEEHPFFYTHKNSY